MTPEEAYFRSPRRIREAEENGATSLDLSDLHFLIQLPGELERLTSLQTLNFCGCVHLNSDLALLPASPRCKRSTFPGVFVSVAIYAPW
jgi:hypothetical protein